VLAETDSYKPCSNSDTLWFEMEQIDVNIHFYSPFKFSTNFTFSVAYIFLEMKLHSLTLFSIFLFTSSFASAKNEEVRLGIISGVVVDSTNRSAVEFANVALIDASTKNAVNGAVCDEQGKFTIGKIAHGNYLLSISFIGYKTKTIKISIAQGKEDLSLGTVLLSSSVTTLKEVVVEGQKALVEEKPDRTIYNAEQDATTKGGDATDVLKRVPLLNVDNDGNVSLKGSTSVRVLINNKPSTITANSVADALKQIPANMIKSVEVITAPSAKYDAEGSAGIINIILKKNNVPGIYATTDFSAGTRGSNAGANVSYRKGKTGLSFGAFIRPQYNVISDFSNTQITRGTDTLTNVQNSRNRTNGFNNAQYTFNWDYDINKNNSLSASVRYGVRNQNAYQDNLLTNTYRHDILVNVSLRNVKTVTSGNNFDASIAYTKTFAKKDRELNFIGIYSKSILNGNNGFVSTSYSQTDGSVLNRYKNQNTGYNQEINLQLDYQEPLSESHLIEFGGKAVLRKVNSDYQYLIAQGDTYDYQPQTSSSLSNSFYYNQNISAGYFNYSFTQNGYALRAGGRYEYTQVDAHFYGSSPVSIPSYGVFVPSINLSKKLSNDRMIRIAFNRRIQRPSLQNLNPNLQASNSLNASIGDPTLKPEYANNAEIAYKTNIPYGTLNLSLFMRYNTNDIQPVRLVRNDTIISKAANIGTEGNYGISAFANVNLTNHLTLSGGTDSFYRILKNNSNDPIINATNSGLTTNFRLFGTYNLPNDFSVQLFGIMQGRSFNLQGYRSIILSQSLSVKKDLWKKAASIGAGIDNFITPYWSVTNVLNSAYVSQNTVTTPHSLIFKINFSYKFGKRLPEKEDKIKKLGADENE